MVLLHVSGTSRRLSRVVHVSQNLQNVNDLSVASSSAGFATLTMALGPRFLKEKKGKKRKKRSNEEDEAYRNLYKQDKVRFGDVVQAPPKLSSKHVGKVSSVGCPVRKIKRMIAVPGAKTKVMTVADSSGRLPARRKSQAIVCGSRYCVAVVYFCVQTSGEISDVCFAGNTGYPHGEGQKCRWETALARKPRGFS